MQLEELLVKIGVDDKFTTSWNRIEAKLNQAAQKAQVTGKAFGGGFDAPGYEARLAHVLDFNEKILRAQGRADEQDRRIVSGWLERRRKMAEAEARNPNRPGFVGGVPVGSTSDITGRLTAHYAARQNAVLLEQARMRTWSNNYEARQTSQAASAQRAVEADQQRNANSRYMQAGYAVAGIGSTFGRVGLHAGAALGGPAGGLIGSVIGTGIDTAASAVGTLVSGLESVVRLTASAVGWAAGLAIEYEKSQAVFAVMTGSKSGGQAMLNEMEAQAIRTPYTFQAVSHAAETLMASGMDPEKVPKMVEQLGDIALGSADKLQHLALAMGHVEGAGKLTGVQLRSFVNAGVGVKDIARSLGIDPTEVRDMMHGKDSSITTAAVEKMIADLTTGRGRFAGASEELSGKVGGRLEALQETAQKFGRRAGKGVFDRLGVAGGINSVIDMVAPATERFLPPVLDFLEKWFVRMIELGQKLYGVFREVWPSLSRAGGALFGNLTGSASDWNGVEKTVVGFFKAALEAATRFAEYMVKEDWGGTFRELTKGITEAAAAMVSFSSPATWEGLRELKTVLGMVQSGLSGVGSLLRIHAITRDPIGSAKTIGGTHIDDVVKGRTAGQFAWDTVKGALTNSAATNFMGVLEGGAALLNVATKGDRLHTAKELADTEAEKEHDRKVAVKEAMGLKLDTMTPSERKVMDDAQAYFEREAAYRTAMSEASQKYPFPGGVGGNNVRNIISAFMPGRGASVTPEIELAVGYLSKTIGAVSESLLGFGKVMAGVAAELPEHVKHIGKGVERQFEEGVNPLDKFQKGNQALADFFGPRLGEKWWGQEHAERVFRQQGMQDFGQAENFLALEKAMHASLEVKLPPALARGSSEAMDAINLAMQGPQTIQERVLQVLEAARQDQMQTQENTRNINDALREAAAKGVVIQKKGF